MKDILTVKNLTFSYRDAPALHKVSFSLAEGDFLGIIGENGTGKSTLMKRILGLLSGYDGEITLFGENRKDFRKNSLLGYVSQKANSFNTEFPATVGEVVSAHLYPDGASLFHKADQTRVNEALSAVDMLEYKDRLIGKLSGGQQQRVFIAAALVSRPKMIFMDEPTVGVDARSTKTISRLIQKLNRQGMTILMTNHDTHALTELANKLLILREDGTADFLTNDRR